MTVRFSAEGMKKKLKAFLIPAELILDNGAGVGVEPKYLANLTVL